MKMYLREKARCKTSYITSSDLFCFNNNKTYVINKTQRNNHITEFIVVVARGSLELSYI